MISLLCGGHGLYRRTVIWILFGLFGDLCVNFGMIHTKFLRRLLYVKRSTNLSALYGELGRVPLIVIRKIRMIKYWIKTVRSPENTLLHKVYLMLKSDADNSVTYNGNNWAYQIKYLLQQIGFANIWLNQFTHNISFTLLKQRILDTYYQSWYAEINNSRRLSTYSLFKHDFLIESYIDNIPILKYRIAMSKFRVSSHDLLIETGRYNNISYDQRICSYCNMNKIESEYHFLLVCPHYRDLRCKYFKAYFCRWPTLKKFEILMSSTSKPSQLNIAKYIYFAMNRRNL